MLFVFQFQQLSQDNRRFWNSSIAPLNVCFSESYFLLLYTNGIFFKQCFGWPIKYGRHRFVSVGLWYKSIHIPLLFRFIKISRKGISLSLNSVVNWTDSLTEFKVSNNSSGFTLFLYNGVWQSTKKRLQSSKINSWNSFPHLSSQIL